MSIFSLLWDILFPKHCVGCNASGSYLCAPCQEALFFFPSPLCPGCGRSVTHVGVHATCRPGSHIDGLFVLTRHEGCIQKLIKHIKYYGHFDIVPTLASLLASHLPDELSHGLAITSVPMHPQGQRKRGYNQSELLAASLARTLHLPHYQLLYKRKMTKKQAGLTRKERLINIKSSFAVRGKIRIPHRVLLVDDVTTTGATLQECAKTLKQAGVREVYAAVIAHGHS